MSAIDNWKRPDWYTPLGGAIMIHGHGSGSDWTEGCIAVENEVMDILLAYVFTTSAIRKYENDLFPRNLKFIFKE